MLVGFPKLSVQEESARFKIWCLPFSSAHHRSWPRMGDRCEARRRSQTKDYRMPQAVDGVDASGETVRLHLSDHPVTDYWDKVGQSVQLGTASPTFDSLEGRCVVAPEHMLTICKIVAAAKFKAFTAEWPLSQTAFRGWLGASDPIFRDQP